MQYRYLFLFSALAAISGCSESADKEISALSLQELVLEIEDIVTTPFADSEEQCRVVAMGVDACGGAGRYLLYSVKNTDEQKLLSLLEQYNTQAEPVAECRALKMPTTIISKSICIPVEHAAR